MFHFFFSASLTRFAMSKDTKLFTFEEVYQHNKEGDIWVIYEGHVLDVTKFNTHPGGPEVLWELAGLCFW